MRSVRGSTPRSSKPKRSKATRNSTSAVSPPLNVNRPFIANAAIGRCTVSWRTEVTSVDGQTITGGTLAGTFSAAARLGVVASEHVGANSGVNVKIEALDPDDAKVGDIAVRADLFHVVTKTAKEQVGPFVYRFRNTETFHESSLARGKDAGRIGLPGCGNRPLRRCDQCARSKYAARQ